MPFPAGPGPFSSMTAATRKRCLPRRLSGPSRHRQPLPVLELLPVPGGMGGVLAPRHQRRTAFLPHRAGRKKPSFLPPAIPAGSSVSGRIPRGSCSTSACALPVPGESIARLLARREARCSGPSTARGYRHAGPRHSSRCGKATWLGVYRYPDGSPIGPFATVPSRETSDITGDIWNSSFSVSHGQRYGAGHHGLRRSERG